MKNLVTCNYAVVRFLPYRETSEFVNVGVVLFCPQAGFFDFALETKKTRRVTDFFPEMPKTLFRTGRQAFEEELRRIRLLFRETSNVEKDFRFGLFRELVRPRGSLFRFGEISTVLAADPKVAIKE